MKTLKQLGKTAKTEEEKKDSFVMNELFYQKLCESQAAKIAALCL